MKAVKAEEWLKYGYSNSAAYVAEEFHLTDLKLAPELRKMLNIELVNYGSSASSAGRATGTPESTARRHTAHVSGQRTTSVGKVTQRPERIQANVTINPYSLITGNMGKCIQLLKQAVEAKKNEDFGEGQGALDILGKELLENLSFLAPNIVSPVWENINEG
jgi:hypothetical protein